MKSVRFYLTEDCNARCSNCFNRNHRSKQSMNIAMFEELCRYFSINGVEHLKIMGGEPTIHKEFAEITQIAQYYFKKVSIFTNAMTNGILLFSPRDSDQIVYNFRFYKAITYDKLLLNSPGERAIEVQVTIHTDANALIEHIYEINKKAGNRVHVFFTLDCTSDLFLNKKQIVPIYEQVYYSCKNNGIYVGQDHIVPICYAMKTKIPIPHSGAICNEDCPGLIDANYNVRFCNQYPEILGNLFSLGHLIAFEKYSQLILSKRNHIMAERTQMQCRGCPYWEQLCNGGCFIR